ncbi:MAG TPA: hypothetical protein VJM11_21090 [Nevskiaceae bacterium]|nr:hypothetical protein [Nevskiaceae bacterium]
MSTTSSRSGFRCLSVLVLAWGPLAASAAEPPRDYALPLTTVAETGDARGIVLVDAANFDATAALVPDTAIVSHTHVVYGGTAGVDRRPHALVYQQDGHWMRTSLREGLAPVPVQVSNASNADTACGSTLVETTRGAVPNAMLVYQLPGPDTTCGTGDDAFRRIGIADAPTTSPSPVPLGTLDLQPVYVSDVLVAVLAHEDGQLRRYPANLATATVVRDADTVMFAGQDAEGTSFVVIDGILRKVTKEGTTPWVAMKRPKSGYSIRQIAIAGNLMFIFEDAVSPSEAWATRVYRLEVDSGGVIVSAILNLAVRSAFAGVTDTKLLYVQGIDSTPDNPIPQELRSVPLDTTQFGTDGKRVYRVENGVIGVVAIRGARIFFNVIDRGAARPYLHADVRRDDGLPMVNGGKGSAWLASEPDVADPLLAGAPTTLVLADNATNIRSLAGANLYRFDAVALTATLIKRLPDGTRPGLLTGTGPATAEDFVTPDAFVLDAAEGRFRRFVGASALR